MKALIIRKEIANLPPKVIEIGILMKEKDDLFIKFCNGFIHSVQNFKVDESWEVLGEIDVDPNLIEKSVTIAVAQKAVEHLTEALQKEILHINRMCK